MATIVYLDVEDEITSAATRIRSAGESRVALVVPFGSRLATSRINFRLLAREATINGRRLDVVAPDASARALAASAGLPVFSSVAEYEAALDDTKAPHDGAGPGAGLAAAAGAGPATEDEAPTRRGRDDGRRGTEEAGRAAADTRRRPAVGDEPPAEPAGNRGEPRVVRPSRRLRIGSGLAIGLGVLALAVVVAGVAAYALLPSAEITIRPRVETIHLDSLVVRADPGATAVDPEAAVIPAQSIEIPVSTQGEFQATGKRVEQTKATGAVRWTNCDPSASYTIPRGTLVKTANGTAFAIDETVFLPVAPTSGTPPNLTVECQSSEVAVTAAKAGTAGNVDPGAIRVIPAAYNRNLITVTNPQPTDGGTRTEFPKVVQADVDAATEQLRKDLDAQFASELEDPGGVQPGATVFPETATLGEPALDVDPATLVDKEVESFTLRMTATGHVLAVDSAPVEAIARSRLEGSVAAGYELLDGSIEVQVGDATVAGGSVSFPVTGSAQQARKLDAAALERTVLGLPRADAEAALAPYGEVELVLWPDWVSAVPTLDQRVTLTVEPPSVPAPTPTPAASPSSSATPDDGASGSPGEPSPSEPVPSP